MKYLITGGCGFVGSNLAAEVLKRNEELIILDNFYRKGSEVNLKWLENQGSLDFYHSDIRNYNDVESLIKDVKPDIVFHLAGQVAMTTSIQDPRKDFEINVIGTHNLLEAVRKYCSNTPILYSSTNKVYGDLEYLTYEEQEKRYVCKEYPEGFDESLTLDFQSPYGCSKGSADQFVLDYARFYDLRTVVFRHSSMFGSNQLSDFHQGWVGWFIKVAKDIKTKNIYEPFTIAGNGKQVRDLLYVDDVVNLYFTSTSNIEKLSGKAFNVGGGYENSMSLLELFTFLESELEIKMKYTQLTPRQSDQKVFIASNKTITKLTKWSPKRTAVDCIKELL